MPVSPEICPKFINMGKYYPQSMLDLVGMGILAAGLVREKAVQNIIIYKVMKIASPAY